MTSYSFAIDTVLVKKTEFFFVPTPFQNNFIEHLRLLHLLPLGEPLLWRRWALCVFCSLVFPTGWSLENLLPCLLPFSTMFLVSPIYFITAGSLVKAHLASVCLWEIIQCGGKPCNSVLSPTCMGSLNTVQTINSLVDPEATSTCEKNMCNSVHTE